MDFSTLGTHTKSAWETWHAINVDASEAGVTVATEAAPTYVSPTAIPGTDGNFAAVDAAVDDCGRRYFLTATGEVYRHDPAVGLAGRGCFLRGDGEPRAICVTRESIHVAIDDPSRVVTYSRTLGQPRWILDDVVDPIAFARAGGSVYLLDGGGRPGRGEVLRLGRNGAVEPVVTGLFEPLDLAADDDGSLYVLDSHVHDRRGRDDRAASGHHAVRAFDADARSDAPVPAVDAIWIPPVGFRERTSGEPFVPTCIAVGATGDLVVGAESTREGQKTLLRYRPTAVAFERQADFTRECSRLALDSGGDRTLVVVDAEGRPFAFDTVYATRRNDRTGGADGSILTRLDAGEPDTRWGRVWLDLDVDAPGVQVRLHYAATDDDRPAPPPADRSRIGDRGTLEDVRGIGSQFARRLRRAGITDPAALADLEPEAVAAAVSVEEVAVSVERAADWIDRADRLRSAERGDLPVETVDGVGPTYAARLRDVGVECLDDLVSLEADELAILVGRELRTVSTERAADWIERARSAVPEAFDGSGLDWKPITHPNPREALLEDAVGRYLWVKIELLGTEYDAPLVRSFDVSFPRRSSLQHLPALYREADESAFLERFLALFESVFIDVEDAIEGLGRYADPAGGPGGADHLEWLGGWLALEADDAWPDAVTRAFVERAPELYRMRGTRAGLLAAIRCYLEHVDVPQPSWQTAIDRERERLDELVADGVLTSEEAASARTRHAALPAREEGEPMVRVLEHADLDCLSDGPERVPYSRLLCSPRGFLVLVHPRLEETHVRAIERIVAAQRPAHAVGRAVGLRPLAVLAGSEEHHDRGVHTYLGINATLSERSFELESSTLGQETVLSEREPYGSLGVRSRLGKDTHVS